MLINLGTPRSPATGDVRRYLREFLMDPRVLDMPALGRWLLVNGVIAPFRAPRSAAAYRKIWGPDGSPQLAHGLALRDALAEELGARLRGRARHALRGAGAGRGARPLARARRRRA